MSPKSTAKSTPSSRSSVLERAREYNRRIEEKDRITSVHQESFEDNDSPTSRSNRSSTRERAMASVLQESESPKEEKEASPPREQEGRAVVTPELLVDALSGHEDGLLAIAERLMEHYDSGYDVMGEAIIDAFADVQKLFQHVVEAALLEVDGFLVLFG